MRTSVKHNDPFINAVYCNWLSQLIQLIQPKDLFLIAGRATAKTSEIIAQRSMDIMYDMPGSQQVFVSDTYVNCLKNIVPTLLEGWNRKGWENGRDFVVDKRPPAHFKPCYKITDSFRNTISTKIGVRILLGSLDQPSGLAGNSFQHMYGDESRLLKFQKLKKLDPAIRGEHAQFSNSVYYRGRTFTTDMPNILDGDDEWILAREKEMNVDQIKAALECGKVVNQIRLQLYNAQIDRASQKEIDLILANLTRWSQKWHRVRKDSTFFYMVSSFVNADILQEGFFTDTYKALGIDEFKTAILSLKVNVSKGEKFYGSLGPHHFYNDGVNSSYYENKYSLSDAVSGNIQESSLALNYIDHNQKLECGIDFGDMCSMVIAQVRGNHIYCLKEFYTLAPENEIELGRKFRSFFKWHKNKTIEIYFDRSGNQNSQTKRDWASAVEKAIKFENGVSTGWNVILMSRNQGTILQETEYNFAKTMMGEINPKIPKLKIDQKLCPHLIASLQLTKIKIKTDKNGSNSLHKDKSSESLALHLRPKYSTNFSDAFKYLICRRDWIVLVSRSSNYAASDPIII